MSFPPVEVLPTYTPQLFQEAVARATVLLRAGEVVALPTETVYGLAANALDPGAVAKIFKLKGRPAHNPIIVHIASRAEAMRCSANWPSLAEKFADAFWPGPLTLVLRRASSIPDIVTAGGPTVGLRWPQHPFIQAVIRACDFPLAAPSANLSNQLSPTRASHVVQAFPHGLKLVVDGGDSNVGLESTVVEVVDRTFRILRPGMITSADLAGVAGVQPEELSTAIATNVAKSPGMLPKHYSPRARLKVMTWKNEGELLKALDQTSTALSRTWVLAHTNLPLSGTLKHVCIIPADAEAYARALYGELHRCDEAGAELIVVEGPPATPAWAAIADRLNRAAGTGDGAQKPA